MVREDGPSTAFQDLVFVHVDLTVVVYCTALALEDIEDQVVYYEVVGPWAVSAGTVSVVTPGMIVGIGVGVVVAAAADVVVAAAAVAVAAAVVVGNSAFLYLGSHSDGWELMLV